MKYALLFVLFTACATSKTKLTDQAKEIRVLEHAKGHGCAVMDKITGSNDKGSEDLAQNHVKNLAAKAGANAVHFDETVQNGSEIKIKATIYKCE
jgi:hypothetical protein